MKKLSLLLSVVFIAFMFISVNAQDAKKETKVIEEKAASIEATRGVSPHITSPKPTNDENRPDKPEQTRGDYCKVIVDNWTSYSIDIYVDGEWAGTVAAWDEGYTWAIEGKTKLYGESVGGTKYWGASYVDCYSQYTWKLTD